LARPFDVEQPDKVWAGDITSLWTAAGWWYLATVLDMYSRQVVGWAMSSRIDAELVQEALRMALGRRRPSAGLMHHSDRGSQYACGTSQALLAENGIRCRMSRKGDGLDHAVAERFFGSLKGERTSLRHYATRQEARDDVIDDIEMFSNSRRKHSYLGYVSPNAFEKLAVVASLSVYFYLTTTIRKLFRKNGQQREELTHAINQIMDWIQYIANNKQRVEEELGLIEISPNPRSLVVIGRSASLTEENRRKLATLQAQQNKLRILTYDDVIAAARANLERLLGPFSLK
jgi:hypothetical protein